jgi:hypothetical protein
MPTTAASKAAKVQFYRTLLDLNLGKAAIVQEYGAIIALARGLL